ncbi:hypothetical protein NQ314_005235 [Rhamnusium bicolor]|uniref:GDP-fucose protein O-fucosyltransferase 2 n=1 Tax=Rhamnusium bicolor TaxID=1586634 RepID=A0AAV8ZHJ8_9CUCU|nr:hypothetical protein NQ314_005235 [Rhamnusium bicolor]
MNFKQFSRFWINIALMLLLISSCSYSDSVCYKNDNKCTKENQFRYLLYDVNAPEGFNLRRDVYMRFAILAHQMQKSDNPALKFKMVLPPWSHLVHWSYSEYPEHIPWSLYFDLKSLQMFAPVIEMHEFFSRYQKKYSKVIIEKVYTLQHFEDMFETGNFEDRLKIEECQDTHKLNFFFYENITAKNVHCLSYHGPATKLTELFLNTSAGTILINHAEVALHEFFGNNLYWQARRSMRFNKELKTIADDFRRIFLKSNDETDNTILPESWKHEKPKRNAIGGSYIAVHLRRRDFVRSRPNETPNLDSVAQQITKILIKLNLNTVFIATDGPKDEFDTLSKMLVHYKLFKYTPSSVIKQKYKEGGVAIIDQIICSYARYFIGTHDSTFTFRIQEEREILGFPSDSTFNTLCKVVGQCHKPSIWTIVY